MCWYHFYNFIFLLTLYQGPKKPQHIATLEQPTKRKKEKKCPILFLFTDMIWFLYDIIQQ